MILSLFEGHPVIFGYQPSSVRLTTDRMVVRQVMERDQWQIADYYTENREFLQPWEPLRDPSYYSASGWQSRLKSMVEQQRQGSASYFILLDREEQHVIGTVNFSQIIRGCFYACHLGYSLSEAHQGQGLMFEGAQAAIRYMQRRQKMHRIMAVYMPRNLRSGALLTRLGFEKEGYARDYLMINGRWEDHILTALSQRAPPESY